MDIRGCTDNSTRNPYFYGYPIGYPSGYPHGQFSQGSLGGGLRGATDDSKTGRNTWAVDAWIRPIKDRIFSASGRYPSYPSLPPKVSERREGMGRRGSLASAARWTRCTGTGKPAENESSAVSGVASGGWWGRQVSVRMR